MSDMEDQIRQVALAAATHGSLEAVDSLGSSEEESPRWMIDVLDFADSWPVRIRAAEILRDWTYCVMLYDEEKKRALRILRRLQEAAIGVALSTQEHMELLNRDKFRDLEHSWLPQYGLDDWLAGVAEEIRGFPSVQWE
jgi:hypothetical protein